MGDLISSLCGFHGASKTSAGRHVEGARISTDYCRVSAQNPTLRNPLDAFIAWLPMPGASAVQLDKAETELILLTNPAYNIAKKKKPKKP